tara:strand:- start:2054 stop:2158 length:105 start_codon:yes stop_codon:yes gene_type:complete
MSRDEEKKKKEPKLVFWVIVLVGTFYMYKKVFNK